MIQDLCVFSGILWGVEPRQDVDRTIGSQSKFKGCGEDKGQNERVGGLEEEQRHGVWQCLASDSGPRLWEATIEAEFAVWKAELTMGKGRTHNGERQSRAGQGMGRERPRCRPVKTKADCTQSIIPLLWQTAWGHNFPEHRTALILVFPTFPALPPATPQLISSCSSHKISLITSCHFLLLYL